MPSIQPYRSASPSKRSVYDLDAGLRPLRRRPRPPRRQLPVLRRPGAAASLARARTPRRSWGAVLVSLVPLAFMFAFSYLLMNRAVDRWFSLPVTELRDDANRATFELFRYAAANARSEADSIAVELSSTNIARPHPTPVDVASINRRRRPARAHPPGGFAIFYIDGRPAYRFTFLPAPPPPMTLFSRPTTPPPPTKARNPPHPSRATPSAARSRRHSSKPRNAAMNPSTRLAPPTTPLRPPAYSTEVSVVALPIPSGISDTAAQLRSAADTYWTLFASAARSARSTCSTCSS